MITEFEAVSAFRVISPKDGGQSIKIKSKLFDISSRVFFKINSLFFLFTSSISTATRSMWEGINFNFFIDVL